MAIELKLALAAAVAWLIRGCFLAYRQRENLTTMQALKVIVGAR